MGISNEIRKLEDRIIAIENREKRRKPVVDCEFNNIMAEDVKIIIARAFISLEAGLRHGKLWNGFSEHEIELVEKKASQMKQEVNEFIDSQKQRIIDASENRWHNGTPVPE